MVATAGASVAAVDHKGVGAEARFKGVFVQAAGVVHQILPGLRWVNVHLDYTGIGGDQQFLQSRIARWLVAFDNHGHLQLGGGGFDGPN